MGMGMPIGITTSKALTAVILFLIHFLSMRNELKDVIKNDSYLSVPHMTNVFNAWALKKYIIHILLLLLLLIIL